MSDKFEDFLNSYYKKHMKDGYTTDQLHMASSFWLGGQRCGEEPGIKQERKRIIAEIREMGQAVGNKQIAIRCNLIADHLEGE